MFSFSTRKKLSEAKLAAMYVRAILDVVDTGFPEVAGLINDDPRFEAPPHIKPSNSDHFLFIIIASNLRYIPEKFPSPQDKRISNLIIEQFASALEMEAGDFMIQVHEYMDFIKKVNEPSINHMHGIVKAMFVKYDLNAHQEEHFRNLNTPSPVFLLRMSDVLANFLWSWDSFFTTYRLTT